MHDNQSAAAPPPLTPGWDLLALVCKECRKRSSGPSGPKAKGLAADLRQAGKERKLKTRAVLTSCMGLCPKNATAVTVVPRGGAARTVAWPPKAATRHAADLLACAANDTVLHRGTAPGTGGLAQP